MQSEIERRFLVDPTRLPKLREGTLQIQGYFNSKANEQPEVRVRVEGQKSTLTLKTLVTNTTRREYEYEIPLKDAQTLLEIAPHRLRKIRHHLKLNNQSWVIDFFQDNNAPLVLAEIELKSEDEVFEKPLWAREEVTDDLRYTAISLAFKPYGNWNS